MLENPFPFTPGEDTEYYSRDQKPTSQFRESFVCGYPEIHLAENPYPFTPGEDEAWYTRLYAVSEQEMLDDSEFILNEGAVSETVLQPLHPIFVPRQRLTTIATPVNVDLYNDDKVFKVF